MKKTVPDSILIKSACLNGYRRIFDFKSPYRKDPKTGEYSSVLNLTKDHLHSILGVLYEVPKIEYTKLAEREAGYSNVKVILDDNQNATTFIATDYESYGFVFNDQTQQEYLDICLSAAEKRGEKFLTNFLQSTYINEKSIADINIK